MLAALLIVSVLLLLGAALLATDRRFSFITLLAGVLLFQNVFVMILLRFGLVSGTGTQILLSAKELLLILALVFFASRRFGRTAVTGHFTYRLLPLLALTWIIAVAVHAVVFGAPWLPRMAGARAVVILPALFILGYWLASSTHIVRHIVRLLIFTGVAIAMFGFLEAYVLPESFWLNIGHEEFYLEKINRPVQGELYNNMRYWLGGQPVRRVASITGDPLISSYPMALLIVGVAAYYFSNFRFRFRHLLFVVPVAFATVLTLSRGALLTTTIAITLLFIARKSARFMTALTGIALVGLVLVVSTMGDSILNFTTGAGHIDQLVDGIKRGIERPLGYGLGTASSVATGVARSSELEELVLGGGDSFMGSLATQMGVPAMLAFYLLMLAMIHKLAWHFVRMQRLDRPNAWWFGTSAAMLAGLLVTSAVNESGFGFVAAGLIYVWSGALHSIGEADYMLEQRSQQSSLQLESSGVAHA